MRVIKEGIDDDEFVNVETFEVDRILVSNVATDEELEEEEGIISGSIFFCSSKEEESEYTGEGVFGLSIPLIGI